MRYIKNILIGSLAIISALRIAIAVITAGWTGILYTGQVHLNLTEPVLTGTLARFVVTLGLIGKRFQDL